MKSGRRIGIGACLVTVILQVGMAGCARWRTTKIADILKDPRAFDGKTVTISGQVKESVNVLLVRGFVVADNSGEIVVITQRSVPKAGSKIQVTGRVDQTFSLGGKTGVVIIEDNPEN